VQSQEIADNPAATASPVPQRGRHQTLAFSFASGIIDPTNITTKGAGREAIDPAGEAVTDQTRDAVAGDRGQRAHHGDDRPAEDDRPRAPSADLMSVAEPIDSGKFETKIATSNAMPYSLTGGEPNAQHRLFRYPV
jgi:hypothetical protein